MAGSARTWTSADGTRTFEGDFQSFDAATGTVGIALPNGKSTEFKIDKLSQTDKAWIQEQRELERRQQREQAALRGLRTLKGFDGKVWTNSLGMKFAPVAPTRVAFAIWETRVKDYAVFAAATNRKCEEPGFDQAPDHPAVMVSWEEARAFCAWLTAKERLDGVIGNDMSYRLPTDPEWSIAVGLPEEQGRTPQEKDGKIEGVYFWGTQWPPPEGAGNYDQSIGADEFQKTSPVGSFAANKLGLFDLGGNVWEWCEDRYAPGYGPQVLRGGSWSGLDRVGLLSSYRLHDAYPGDRRNVIGFRCVLVVLGG